MHVTTSLKGLEARVTDLSTFEISETCQTKELYVSTLLQLTKLFPKGVQVKSFDTAIQYIGTESLSEWLVDGGIQIFHCWNGKYGYAGEEARMIHVLMSRSWRHQSELTMTLRNYGWLYIEIFLAMCTYTGQYTHIYFLALSAEKTWKQQHPVTTNTPSTLISVVNTFLH